MSIFSPISSKLTAADWTPFDVFMSRALYHPTLGYYTRSQDQIGKDATTSDFVTSPVISPYFGQALANQISECLAATGTDEIWEFGAGTGALALQLLCALGNRVRKYHIVDVSGSLQALQQKTLQVAPALASKVVWQQSLPDSLAGVIVGNEVLDAMPVKLLVRKNNIWFERGVVSMNDELHFADEVTDLRPPVEILGPHDYVTEIHPQGLGFIQTLADKLRQSERGGAVIMIDYGFTESEYYHPQRHMGTLMCHRGHQSDGNPLLEVGEKDITAHVDFTGIALAAQNAGLHVNGYTSQGRFLLNCGLLALLAEVSATEKAMAQKLITEHEMGELFKVICLSTLEDFEPMGFVAGDRTHTL